MHDQANTLRALVRHTAADSPAHRVRPAIVVVTGGKGGVGTTTVAVHLAVAAARTGTRTVLLDADLHGGDAAMRFGLPERYTLADVLAGRRTLDEAMQSGGDGLNVLAGAWGYEEPLDDPDTAGRLLLEQLETIAPQTDLAVLDAGNGFHPMLLRLARAAGAVLTVTVPETPSVLAGYATIKALVRRGVAVPLYALVNRAASPAAARDVHARLAEACRCFLAVELHRAGDLPDDRAVATADNSHQPLSIAGSQSTAVRQLTHLAKTLTASCLPARPTNKPSVSASIPSPRTSQPRRPTNPEKTPKTLQP